MSSSSFSILRSTAAILAALHTLRGLLQVPGLVFAARSAALECGAQHRFWEGTASR